MTAAHAQSIRAGPIEADTGNNLLDFGVVIALILLVLVVAPLLRHWLKLR